jgi:hypothetical protein
MNIRRINLPIAITLLLTLLFSFSSCSNARKIEYCELGIVLTKDFEEYDSEGSFSVAYSDGNTIVGISRYSFVDCEQLGLLTTFTPLKLANVYLDMMDRTVDEKVKQHGDVPYFTYTQTDKDGVSYFYMPSFYRTPYAYFVITFITPKSREAEGRVEFYGYMDTVYLLEEYL